MRYKIIIPLFWALVTAPNTVWAGVKVSESTDQGIVLELSCPQPQFEKVLIKGTEYFRVTAAGCPGLTEPGRPALPVIGAMILVPPNAIPEIVSAEPAETVNYKKIPAPAPEILLDKETVPDPVVYRGGQVYPANLVSLSRPVRAGLHKMAFISFNPVRFYPAGGNLSYVKSIKVRVRFKPSGLGDQPLAPGKADQLTAGIGMIAAKSAANPTQMAGWASRPASGKKTKSSVWADTLPYKILIEEEGIYKIGYYDLLQAGLNPGWFDPRSYKLFNQGREVPIYFKGQADGVFDQDDYFEFYGQRLKGDSSYYHPYSRDNVYWLGAGGSFGARMIEEDGSPLNQNYVLPGSCRYKMHLEKDSLFYRLNSPSSDQTDRWFWQRIDKSDSMVLSFSLPGLDSGAIDSVNLTIGLHGYTELDEDSFPGNDHWAIITLNGKSLDNYVRWDGQTPHIFETKLDPDRLVEGQNRLVLKHGPLGTSDTYFFNWMEVEYSRRYVANGGSVAFKAPSQGSDSLFRYEIKGFENQSIDLYKLGVSKITGTVVERDPDGITYRLTFEDRASSQTGYYAVQNDDRHKLKPKAIVANHIPAQALTDPSQSAQYLIITTEEFLAPAARLAAIRGTQFNGSKVVLASDIYDAFNYGIPQDRPIKEFLRQAFMTGQVPPAYVLLLGGGSWDPRNLSGHSYSDKIPAHLTRTSDFGPTADDNYYADILDDDQFPSLPDIAVGRIPVNNANDCQIWETKQLSYEQQPLLDQWQRDFMLIAGRNVNSGDNFDGESNLLAASLDTRYTVSKVYHSNPATTQDLIDQFNEGSVLAGFNGHGGGQVWSHDSFFRLDEVAMFNNWGRWPLVGSFTCHSGAFDIPDTVSLSQAMLLKTYSGAVGVFASSGPSWESVIEQAFFGAVDDYDLTRFGDILISSKFELAAKTGMSVHAGEMITSYNLLGDPGMRLAVSHRNIEMTLIPASLLPGDSLTVTIRGGFKAGSITLLSLCDSVGNPVVNSSLFSDTVGKVAARVKVPDSMSTGKALMKAFVKDADSSWIACGEMGINRPVIYGITATPARPVNLVDSVDIVAGASSLWGIDSVWCEWRTSTIRSDTGLLQSTLMDSSAPGWFKLRTKIINVGPSDTVLNYRICLSGPAAAKLVSSWKHHHLLTRPDLTPREKINSNDNSYFGGKRRLTIFTDIYNNGETRADSIPLHFYRYNNELPPKDSVTVMLDSILPGTKAVAAVPWTLDPGKEADTIKLSIDPYAKSWPPEQDTSNNHFASNSYDLPKYPDEKVYRQLGLLGSVDTVSLSKYPVRYFLPDSSLLDSAVAVVGYEPVNQTSPLNPVRQPGLKLIGDQLRDVYFMTITDSTRGLSNGKKLWISLDWPQLDEISDLSLVNLYRFNTRQGLWQKVPGEADTVKVWGFSDSLGTFMPLIGTDTTAPLITARLEQQATGWGQTVKVSRPQYSVLIEDPNGINLDSVWVKKDVALVPRNEYNLPTQPQDHTSVPLAYAPYLTDGQHTLEFGACDNLGNSSAVSVQLTVAAEFGLYYLACYPTPVDGNYATFYFFVGDHADQYELKIYTVAGRLIKTFKGGYVPGEKRLNWNVDDDSGQRVANGVYFYTVEVWSDGRYQKKTEKLAVLR
ncbi:hypothetical protein HY768_08375 [candidate division TA06 bacterium]|uniref:Gingipain domain-containing protein n=1 Tax=candidate division TA06 bacterium TaxID=2250710 RepID=A0A933MKQ2_UNCT6|nr:hypothetical protein [candidate division TA06 bacterium]